MNVFFIVALVFLAVLVLCLSFYVYKKRQNQSEMSVRIGIYISAIGVVVAVLVGIMTITMNIKNDRKPISNVTTTTDQRAIVTEEYTYQSTDKPTENNTEFSETLYYDYSDTTEINSLEGNNDSLLQTEPLQTDTPQSTPHTPLKSLILKSSSKHYNLSQTEYDPRGKMYTNVIYLYSSATNGIGYNGKLELYTEKKYSTLNCSLVPQADFSTNDGAGAYVEIYKDDLLSYTSDLITYKTNALDIDLDIRGTDYLQIKVINVNPNHPYMANADILICDAFVEE